MTITSKDQRMMNLAAKMALTSSHPRYRMAAIIAAGSRVLAVGLNKVSSPKRFTLKRDKMNLHAEISAIYNLEKSQTKGTTLYIWGQTVSGNLVVSKPCYVCENALDEMGVRRIVYSNRGILEEVR